MWFVYLLRCGDGSLYTGITNHLVRRMLAHRSGIASKYTRARGFGLLLGWVVCDSRSSASKLEFEIKRLSREKKLSFFGL